MRSEHRIDNFLRILGEKWKEQGVDLRFTQFLFNNNIHDTNIQYHLEEPEVLKLMFPDIRASEYTFWGTYGKDGKSPCTYKIISSLDTDHIEIIIETQTHIPDDLKKIFEEELAFRKSDAYIKSC